jgi:cold shock CspA family protein
MNKSDKILMIRVPNDDVEETLKDAIDKTDVERGLVMRANIGKEVFKHFKMFKEKGYFPVGMILEDGQNVEFLFQRHPKQTKSMRMVEMKTPKELKHKL